MHLLIRSISTTRCDDLARATEAQDGKKKLVVPSFHRKKSIGRESFYSWEVRHLLLRHHILFDDQLQPMHGLERAWISKILLGGDFPMLKPCGSNGPDSIGVRVCRILDAFSAQAVVYSWNHPRRDKDREEFHIPDQLSSLWNLLLCDTSHLTVDNSSVGLFPTKGGCDFEA